MPMHDTGSVRSKLILMAVATTVVALLSAGVAMLLLDLRTFQRYWIDDLTTQADIVAVVPGEDVIFMGDLVESAGDPQFSTASDFRNWPKVLDGVLGASTEATRFVPGHGLTDPWSLMVDRDFCFRQRAEIAMVQGTVEDLVHRGVMVQDALGAADWPFSLETMQIMLPLLYQDLARRGLEPRKQLPLA